MYIYMCVCGHIPYHIPSIRLKHGRYMYHPYLSQKKRTSFPTVFSAMWRHLWRFLVIAACVAEDYALHESLGEQLRSAPLG